MNAKEKSMKQALNAIAGMKVEDRTNLNELAQVVALMKAIAKIELAKSE